MGMSSTSTYKICMCFTGKLGVVEEAEPPLDLKEAFGKYTEGGTHMTAEQLERFLVEVQGEAEGAAHGILQQILQKRHRMGIHAKRHEQHLMTMEDYFQYYLFSTELNPPIESKVDHDMTAPLSHYFIYTGHNSYLTGNQLTSNCSDVPIIKALKMGVRAIELDLWPNSTKDDIRVLHGRTATTPVELTRCLKSIREYAFSASPYPVILTLEDHLTPHLQAKVAQMLSETLGNMLFYPESDYLEEFPSPEELKYRIIISTKPPKEYHQVRIIQANVNSPQKCKDFDEEVRGKEPSLRIMVEQEDSDDKSESEMSYSCRNCEDDNDLDQKVLPAPEYKHLIAIHARKLQGEIKNALKVESGKVRRLTLKEQDFEKAVESHGEDIIRFTQKNILRVYPKGTRVNSSNFKPMLGWMHGAQMIAFNMQGYGRALWLMQGMFRANGGCGYVKKPDILMNNNEIFEPKTKYHVKKILKVKVYMGYGWHIDFKPTHFDSYSRPDFYMRVGIAGVPLDEVMKKSKKKEKTWTPVWDQEFTFPLTVPELALLRIEVHEYDMSGKDKFAGQNCLLISELRSGIRTVPLYNRKGDKFNSVRLLIGFEIS